MASAKEDSVNNKTYRIAFIHPDLGIGGAERLIVDAAVGLQELGNDVEIFTSWHDPNHCFEQTRDGTLKVHHVKTKVPREVFSAFHLPLAILRQLSLLMQLLISLFAFRYPGAVPSFLYRKATVLSPLEGFDIFIVDQLSACVPALRILTQTRVIFYCHYPDKEVGNSIARQKAIDRGQSGPGLLRTLYRIPFDFLEEMTISTSDKILVNSQFTCNQFVKTFFRLARIPRVVYPGIDTSVYREEKIEEAVGKLEAKDASARSDGTHKAAIQHLIRADDRPTLLSINRFEAKKNIALAIETFVQTRKDYAATGKQGQLRLVLAGGYDNRLEENIVTLRELKAQCDANSLAHQTLTYNQPSGAGKAPSSSEIDSASVIFLPSAPFPILGALLAHRQTRALLYTPTEEHFGIVPLEAMAVGLPVLATNTGGPMESVVDLSIKQSASSSSSNADTGTTPTVVYSNEEEGTGLLRRPVAKIWAKATLDLLCLQDSQRAQISRNAKARVEQNFSLQSMSKAFERCIEDLDQKGPVRSDEGLLQWSAAIGMFFLMMTCFLALFYFSHKREAQLLVQVRGAKESIASLQAQITSKA